MWCLYNDHCLDIVMIIWSSINCPTVICLPTVCYFSREKASSETYDPRVSFHHICLCDLFSISFIFKSIKPKIKKILLEFICSAIYLFYLPLLPHVICLSWGVVPGRDWQPIYTLGCEYLLFVCRCCLCGVRRFSYWFDNLGLITEGNTYHHYTVLNPLVIGSSYLDLLKI